MERMQKTLLALKNNGFCVYLAEDCERALSLALDLIGEKSVGFGGSMTVEKLGLYPALKSKGNCAFWHWKGDSLEQAAFAEVYVCSANAVTESGKIILCDGVGNRIGALISGPREALLIVGKNKIVENVKQGLKRIKEISCPLNALRLGLNTPCAVTGECADCRTEERMCSVTTVFERPSKRLFKTSVILVEEDLGY